MKDVALRLADMESFLKRRQAEEERIQTEIQDAFAELNRSAAFASHDSHTYGSRNLYIHTKYELLTVGLPLLSPSLVQHTQAG